MSVVGGGNSPVVLCCEREGGDLLWRVLFEENL